MTSQVTVHADFLDDVRSYALGLLQQAGISTAAVQTTDTAAVLEAYFNVVLKVVDSRPRKVQWSAELRGKALLPDVATGVHLIEARCIAGDSLEPHFSKRATKPHTNDWLLNHCSVHHLHVRQPQGDELLYVWVEPDDIYFLDVRGHVAMAGVDLLEIVLANWPELLGPPLPAKGGDFMTADEIDQARRSGLTPPIRLSDGNYYYPAETGLLVGTRDSRGQSFEAGSRADFVMNRTHKLEQLFRQNAEKAAHDAGATELSVHYHPGANVITDANTGHSWPVTFYDQ